MPKELDFVAPNRIRALRKAAGLRLVDLAEPMGTTPAQVARLENGDRELTVHWMQRIAQVLGCAPADLLLPQDGGLDPRERELVETVQQVPEAAQEMFYRLAETQQAYRHAEPEADRLTPRKRA